MNKQVIEFYNKRNNEHQIISYNKKIKEFKILWADHEYKIAFYEFIINPDYKVFEVFKFDTANIFDLCDESNKKFDKFKQPKKILEYLSKQTGGTNE